MQTHEIKITNAGYDCSCGMGRTTVVGGEGSRLAYHHQRASKGIGDEAIVVDYRTQEIEPKIIPTENWVVED